MRSRTPTRFALLLTTSLVATSLLYTASWAQTVASSESATAVPSGELDTVIVSAARDAKQSDLDMSTTVLTHDQVVNAPEASLDQILNKLPGVQISMVPSN